MPGQPDTDAALERIEAALQQIALRLDALEGTVAESRRTLRDAQIAAINAAMGATREA